LPGIGRVEGREVHDLCNDATVKGGTYYPMTVKKHLRAQEIAEENRLPCIYLVDSGGANLPNQDEVFPDREHFGRIFFNQANMSAKGIAQIAVVMGSCTAGGAYVPAMSDETIIVKKQGTIFLAGPPLVKAATGEVVVGAETLGGGDVHTRLSGVADHLARDDAHALALAREIVATSTAPRPEHRARRAGRARSTTRTNPDGRRAGRPKTPYDVREVIARIVDGSASTSSSALRHDAGLRLCPYPRHAGRHHRQQWRAVFRKRGEGRAFRRAVLPAQDPAGVPAEHHRLHGRLEIRGRRHRQGRRQAGDGGVRPRGAEGHHDHRRLLWRRQLRHVRPGLFAALPVDVAKCRISVMGGEQAAGVLATVKRDGIERKGGTGRRKRKPSSSSRRWTMFAEQGHPLYASARLWDDGIIDPRKTRDVLALSLSAALNAPDRGNKFGVFRM
jgi:3-methylcrotonyl-CoA carboxylase beta subunit